MIRKLACVLLAITLAAPPAVAATPTTAPDTEYLGAITLITGDRVTLRRVGDRFVPAITPAPGREAVHFATVGDRERYHVVPADAWPRINAGTLDRRLFDVASLLREGYGDAKRADLPLITGSTLDPEVRSKANLASTWVHQDTPVWLDGLRKPSLDGTATQIGAPTAWKSGITGSGVTVAVLDTGVDHTHPDLRDRIAGSRNFTTDPSTRDTDGHGTHVAATIAGSGRASDGRYKGIAPDARLLIGKVCAANGCPESAILNGMRWAAEQGATVVNLSLGGPDAQGSDPLELAVDQLSARHGTLFVVAAGNSGSYGAETVSSPASADAALAVGAVDRADGLAGFSSRGPRVHDAAIKPEIVAPGVDVVAARSRHAFGEGHHSTLSGTSMAAPHVAGAAAILAQRHPEWTGAQLKAALMGSAHPLPDIGVFKQGAGRVDIEHALGQTITADPPALSFGRALHDDDTPVTRRLTYHNPTAGPVELTLTASGPFTVSLAAITLPANGNASVEVTANAGDGALSGTVTARSAGGTTTTPLAIDREPESYDLTIRAIDRDGAPTDANFAFLFGGPEFRYRPFATVNGTGTVRVRRGTYHVDGVIGTPRADGNGDSHKVVYPTVEVTKDTTVILDAKAARPITVDFATRGVTPKAVGAGYSRSDETSLLLTGIFSDTFERIHLGQVGTPVDNITANIGGAWIAPGNRVYHLTWFDYGHVPTGFARRVEDAGLAKVVTTYRRQDSHHRGTKLWVAREPRYQEAIGYGLPFDLPVTRTEYHNTDGLAWSGEFQHTRGQTVDQIVVGAPVDHQSGGSYADDWNTAVFGPSLAGGDWASRFGDTLSLAIPMFSDSGNDRYGLSTYDYGRTFLYRDGVKVGETKQAGQGSFDVPAEQARYHLTTTATRSATYATLVTATWTFTSQRAEDPKALGKEGVGLPISAIRFAPEDLDVRNRAPGATATVAITVAPNTGSEPSPTATLTAEASFDDGLTWHPLTVTRTGDHTATATVHHPAGAEHVSLRANATDDRGSEAELTVLRAYGR